MRRVWLAVLNDGTDEINNTHSLEVVLERNRSAYYSVRKALIQAYGEEDYGVDADDTNGYLLMPEKAGLLDGTHRYHSLENRLDCDGEAFYSEGEVIEDPMGRSFMVFFVDPDVRLDSHPDRDSMLNALSWYPHAEKHFLPLSDILVMLDVLRKLPPLTSDSARTR